MNKSLQEKAPFEGLRVLDFGQYVAGPTAAMMLGDQGAEVIRIDYKTGNKWDNPIIDALNRRKKSIALNLKDESDLEIAKKLIMTADVLIENFGLGVMERLGLSYEETKKLNDKLIYVSIPGFSSKDEEFINLKAWEEVIAAVSGQFTDMGLNRVLMGINPSFTSLTLSSAYASVFAAMAASGALFAREAHEIGDYIEVPIATALTEGLAYNSMLVENYPDRYCSPRELEINKRRAEGRPMDMEFDDLQEFLDPFYRSYFCKDGRPVYLVCASQITHSHTALKLLSLYDEAMEAGFPELGDWYLPTNEWPKGVDCALGLYPLSRKWAEWIAPKMKEKFSEKTSLEWEKIFGEAGCPLGAHRTTKEWINSEHAIKSGLIHEVNHPERGLVRQIGPIGWVDSSKELCGTGELPPKLDGNRDEILKSLEDVKPIQSNKNHPKEGWLEGLNVLDMTNVIAGPMVAGTLVRFGAEVIKLDAVKPTFDPWNTIAIGILTQQSKKSMLTNVKTEKGQEILDKLIKRADVITYNGRDEQFEKLGIDFETVKRINPKTILVKVDAYSGPMEGPKTHYPGYDDLLQASTGVMSRFGGGMDTPEEHAHMGTIDVLCGHCAAFATMVALYKLRKTGVAEMAHASLASAGQLIQVPFMYDYEGREPFNEPSGREVKGWNSLIRCYEAEDKWFFLRCGEDKIHELEKIEEIKGVKRMNEEERIEFLSNIFKSQRVDYWVGKLSEVGIGAGRLGSLTELRRDYSFDENGIAYYEEPTYQFVKYNNHPCGSRVYLSAPCAVRPKEATINPMVPSQKYGQSTVEILKRLGYIEKEIDEMVEDKVIGLKWSEDYLPE
ncbi:CoA transferase [Anaeromicrobium sediminis]|uniref:Carnitine dehydratase n=1 Tax=Anaeromicrobium sediminis TaxID=1478221 RepID=A0A267MJZ9_9FIRM|nr:CoA transferase [Anaeromicrobium sediminis]PAB59742.1 hypothetical protein CCE28_09250 [Anaeromicrobium sediminis]